MRTFPGIRFKISLSALASLCLASACTTYVPVQSGIARLTPEQLAAINSNDKLSAEQKQRLTEQNQQILKDQDEARAASTVIVSPAYPVTYPVYPAYVYPGYGYPYGYPAYSPFWPGISLSLGYVWGRNVGPGWRGHR